MDRWRGQVSVAFGSDPAAIERRIFGLYHARHEFTEFAGPTADARRMPKDLRAALEHGVMPFPRASQLMVAYLAWPNDRKQRDRWMATTLALFIAEGDRTGSAAQPNLRLGDQSAFELFGWLRTVADVSLAQMTRKLEPIQKRWLHVADILQMVVDMPHEERASISGGASISEAQEILLGYSSLPRRATLSKDWSDFRDISHLITAAAAVVFLCRDISKGASAVLAPVLQKGRRAMATDIFNVVKQAA